MDNQLTFGSCAALLRANSYAPAPCGSDGKPLGPFALMQIAYDKYEANNSAPVAVLTAIPPARNELEPVQDYRSTWLAKLIVRVRAELTDDVETIIKRYVGTSRCPVLIGDDGALLFVFRSDEAFPGLQADHAHEPDYVRVEASMSFIPVDGNWRGAIDLLSVTRAELPELDHLKADTLINELNQLLHDHAPPVELPAPSAPKPLVEPGKQLLFGNTRAMQVLRDNGYSPCPVSQEDGLWKVPKLEPHVAQYCDGYRLSDERYADFGVGLLTTYARPSLLFDMSALKAGATWLAELEVRARPDIAAAIHSIIAARHGQGPMRIASDGSRCYVFKRVYGMPLATTDFIRSATNADGFPALGATVRIRIASAPVIVVSGADVARWEHGDPLTVARDDLPALDGNLAHSILRAVEQLLASGTISDAPAPKRSRKNAA